MTEVRAPRDDSDWDGYTEVLVRSFGGDAEGWRLWFDGPREHAIVRLAADGDRVVAGAAVLPVGQRFGGRVVPSAAVAAVCAAPEARGRGAGGAVLSALGDAAREAGLLVSPLWSARTTVYRRAGWELVGRAHEHAIDLDLLRGLGRRGEPALGPGVEARDLHRTLVERWNGPLERPEWWWRWRYERDRPHPRERVGWAEEGRLTGFASFEREPADGASYLIGVHELWTSTPDALGGLAAFLASHGSIAREVRLYQRAAPETPDLAWLLPPGTVRSQARDPWMLRLLDPAAALAARGWPDGVALRLDLEVEDPWRPAPERLRLEIEGGEARAAPGGEGRVRLGVGALAAWYAGAMPATRGARLGLVEGPAADLAAMDALTADRPVWLPDAF